MPAFFSLDSVFTDTTLFDSITGSVRMEVTGVLSLEAFKRCQPLEDGSWQSQSCRDTQVVSYAKWCAPHCTSFNFKHLGANDLQHDVT